MRIHHIGYAVREIGPAAAVFESLGFVKEGEIVEEGAVLGTVRETDAFTHRIMAIGAYGRVTGIAEEGEYTIGETVATLDCGGEQRTVSMSSRFPVRTPRPSGDYIKPDTILFTGLICTVV